LFRRNKLRTTGVAALAASALVLAGCAGTEASTEESSGQETAVEQVSISVLFGTDSILSVAEASVAAFESANPNIEVTLETRPGGVDGDNVIKTKLATGEMNDVFFYNSGSLMQALNPDDTLVDLSNEAWTSNIIESFWPAVSTPNGKYGAPMGTAMGGGILYNRIIYADLGLSIPLTWSEFMANNEKIKAAGIDPVIQTYGENWTAQLLVLADHHNVEQSDPQFVEEYTNNIAKISNTPSAFRGYEHLQELHDKDYFNSDYASAILNDGLTQLVNGEGAHYPMLTFAVSSILEIAPEKINDIGFFAQPGDDAATNGLTVWVPNAIYIPKTSEGAKLEAAKKFVDFIVSKEGVQIYIDTIGQTGPFLTVDAPSADELYQPYVDMFPYFDRAGDTTPALEFLSPVKGPNLSQITVSVGTGQYSAEEGAEAYDEDVKKQAEQLALPGW